MPAGLALLFICAEFVDQDGTKWGPGLSLSCRIAVPALGIPASNVTLLVANGSGVVQQNFILKVRSSCPCNSKTAPRLPPPPLLLPTTEGSGSVQLDRLVHC